MNEPRVSRPMMVVVTLAVTCFTGIAVWRQDYRTALILVAFLMFIAGADLGSMMRAWRGTPETPAVVPPPAPSPPSLSKDDT